MSCKTADFVEFRAGATEPKHCVTESLAQHRRREKGEEGGPKWGLRKFPLAGRNRRPPQHFMRRTRHWAGAFVTWDWRVHFLTSGPTGEMYLPPGCIPAKANVAGIFYGRGGSNWRNSPGNVSIHRQRGPSNYGGPLYTIHKRDQEDANQLRPMGGLCGLQRLRSDRSTTRPCPGIRFFCVCVSSSAVLLVL